MRHHILVVSEKKIEMLKILFVIAQSEVLGGATITFDPPRLQTLT